MSQDSLFRDDDAPAWKDEWQGMPEFVQEQQRPFAQIIVRFRNQEDLDEFAQLIGQKLNAKSQCTWHPERPLRRYTKRYVDESELSGLHSLKGSLEKPPDQPSVRPNESAVSNSD
jgi:hypothetical protein